MIHNWKRQLLDGLSSIFEPGSASASVKYELIYLKAFEDGHHLSQEVGQWFEWYNEKRFHQALGYKTPHQVYSENVRIGNRIQNSTESKSS